MSLGVDYAAGDAKIRSKYFYTMNGNYAINNNQDTQKNGFNTNQAQTDTFVSSLVGDVGSGNTCTDGKDDGKIGIGGVVANVAQGAIRTIPNMIKGAFTNSEGKFSLAKTALTIGIGAACVAFPAVGLGLCAVGMGAGAIKAGSNVVKALNADTDAEAKAAWEHVGSGATTAALSYVGAKASYHAMESSAGNASVLEDGNIIEYAKSNGIKKTAEGLLNDAWHSTKNNAGKITNALKGYFDTSKLNSNARELNKLEGIEPDKITDAQAKRLNELKSDSKVCDKAAELKKASEAKAVEKSYNKAKKVYEKELKGIDENRINELQKQVDSISDETGALSEEQLAEQTKLLDELETLSNKKFDADSKFLKAQQTYQNSMPENSSVGKTNFNLTNKLSSLKEGINKSRENINPASLEKLSKKLGSDGLNIAKAIMNKDIPEANIISEFGSKKVSQVIEILAGERSADNSL